MNVTLKLILVELKLLTRDPGVLFFGLIFPALLLVVLGALPGFTDPDPDLGGFSLIELYTPIVLVLTFAMVGVATLAPALTTYRRSGVLRRLQATPVGPSRLLAAQLVANLLAALLASALAVVVALVAFDVGGPASWLGFAAGLTLGAASLFSLGLLVGALAPSPSAAGTIGTLVWLPLMVLGGLWFPREAMPDMMRRISDLSPAGAAVDAVQEAWFSGVTPIASLAVMAATVVVIGAIASVTFRWE